MKELIEHILMCIFVPGIPLAIYYFAMGLASFKTVGPH